jgi:hypothetical protein
MLDFRETHPCAQQDNTFSLGGSRREFISQLDEEMNHGG